MQRSSRLTAAVLAGLVTTGSLAATLAMTAPASAADHRGNWSARSRGHVDVRRDWRPEWRRDARPVYQYPATTYVYPAPTYPVYPAYPYSYAPPAGGYIHVQGPGWGVGFSL